MKTESIKFEKKSEVVGSAGFGRLCLKFLVGRVGGYYGCFNRQVLWLTPRCSERNYFERHAIGSHKPRAVVRTPFFKFLAYFRRSRRVGYDLQRQSNPD